jgi:hypothetical protein
MSWRMLYELTFKLGLNVGLIINRQLTYFKMIINQMNQLKTNCHSRLTIYWPDFKERKDNKKQVRTKHVLNLDSFLVN